MPATSHGTARAVIEHARDLLQPALRQVLHRLEPDLARICAYTLGWCAADGSPLGAEGTGQRQRGSGRRSALGLLSGQAVGAAPEVWSPGNLSVELLHTFTVLHDDIIDKDEVRRHRPTAWTIFGIGPAMLAGDALLMASITVLTEVDGDTGVAAARQLSDVAARMIDGEARDIAIESRPWLGPGAVGVEEYMAMSAAKTGEFIGSATSLNATLAAAPPETVRTLHQIGLHLGRGWQIINDLTDLWGDSAETGKGANSDLRERKKNFPIIAALTEGTADARRLAELLAGDRTDDATVRLMADLVARTGAREYSEELARREIDQAVALLGEVAMPDRVRMEFRDVIGFYSDISLRIPQMNGR